MATSFARSSGESLASAAARASRVSVLSLSWKPQQESSKRSTAFTLSPLPVLLACGVPQLDTLGVTGSSPIAPICCKASFQGLGYIGAQVLLHFRPEICRSRGLALGPGPQAGVGHRQVCAKGRAQCRTGALPRPERLSRAKVRYFRSRSRASAPSASAFLPARTGRCPALGAGLPALGAGLPTPPRGRSASRCAAVDQEARHVPPRSLPAPACHGLRQQGIAAACSVDYKGAWILSMLKLACSKGDRVFPRRWSNSSWLASGTSSVSPSATSR